MQVSVESKSGLERKLTVTVPAEKIETEIQKRLQSLTSKAKIQGFRPGKVPLSVIKRTYGAQVQQEVEGEILQSTFYEAVTQEKLNPANKPQIEPKAREAGQAFEYSATFEIYPEIKLAAFDGVEIEKPVADISDADVDSVIERLRIQKVEWKGVDRASKQGDKLTIDFQGFIDDKPFDGGEGKALPIELGSKRMIEGFETQLEGAKSAESRTLDLKFPDNYQSAEVAGKPVKFEVTVITVEEPVLPEINEEFIKGIGIAAGTQEALRKDVKDSMTKELNEKIKSVLKQNVMDKLLEINQIEVPNSLIDKEIDTLKTRSGVTAGQLNSQEGGPDAFSSVLEKEARRRVTLGLVLSETVKQNNIKAEPKKVRELVENIASSYEKPQEVLQYYYGDNNRLAEVESVALENETVEWISTQVKLKDVKTTFDALMKPGQTVA
ncbi:MAG: trigger factor [Gammaproteobacteria bacterium]|nr:trigger factor [Gammaproteobacteria bacterium]